MTGFTSILHKGFLLSKVGSTFPILTIKNLTRTIYITECLKKMELSSYVPHTEDFLFRQVIFKIHILIIQF